MDWTRLVSQSHLSHQNVRQWCKLCIINIYVSAKHIKPGFHRRIDFARACQGSGLFNSDNGTVSPKKELFVVRHFTTFNELQNLTGWLWDQLLSKARLLERGKTSGRADDNLALSSAQGSVPFSFETRNSYQLFWELVNWRQFPCFQQCFWSGFVNLRSFHASPMMPYVSMVENGWPANKWMIGMLQYRM